MNKVTCDNCKYKQTKIGIYYLCEYHVIPVTDSTKSCDDYKELRDKSDSYEQ